MSLAVPSEDTARLRLQKVLQQTPLFADLEPEALAARARGFVRAGTTARGGLK